MFLLKLNFSPSIHTLQQKKVAHTNKQQIKRAIKTQNEKHKSEQSIVFLLIFGFSKLNY